MPAKKTAMQWISRLRREYARTQNIHTGAALLQLLLVGNFRASASADMPAFLHGAIITFGVGGPIATGKDKEEILRSIATLAKHKAPLRRLLRHMTTDAFKDGAWTDVFKDETPLCVYEDETKHPCWELARSLEKGDMSHLSVQSMHKLLVLWSFWVFRQHEWIEQPAVDFLGFSAYAPTLTDFVASCT